jgi:hypothetical protein
LVVGLGLNRPGGRWNWHLHVHRFT